MLTSAVAPISTEYPRSILEAVGAALDRVEQRIPPPPQPMQWNGGAKTMYEAELARLGELVIIARAHHERLLDALTTAGSCG